MINIAVLGYGTVGSGVVEVINKNHASINKRAGQEVNIKYVLDLRDFPGDPVEKVLVHDYNVIVNDPEVKIIVEVMGGIKPAYDFTKQALEAGKSVCTSNKELVAAHGAELLAIAKANKVNFLFEASVGGGIPIIRPLNQSLTADEITEITGILNGTTNYMLTRMGEEGLSFEEALKEAQEKGYADVTKMGENFAAYLGTADGKQRLSNGLSETLDMKSLESQLSSGMNAYMKQAMGAYAKSFGNALETQIGQNLQSVMTDAMKVDTDAFAKAFQFNMTEDDLTELMMSMSGTASATYDSNLQKLGYADFAKPSEIDIYPKDFESKEQVVDYLDRYNKKMEKAGKDEQVISYTDVVGTLMSSVTDIVNTISYVLIAFVAISLVVSSIMIGVITYISVLERKKEIGILRAIGASKRNVSQVFNAETFIIGLCAGLIGIGLTLLLLLPGNMIIHAVADNSNVNAVLPVIPALVLIALSVVLTLLGGLIPSKKASKSDPVTALRTE